VRSVNNLSFSEASSPPTPERTLPQEDPDRLRKHPLPAQWQGGEYERIRRLRSADAIARSVAKEEKIPLVALLEAFAKAMAVAKTDPETVRTGDMVQIGKATEACLRPLAEGLEASKSARYPRPFDKWHEASVQYDIALLRTLLMQHYDRL
jgi:hypothetical protein